jgi:23S rRNA pseudouridine2605 synthase
MTGGAGDGDTDERLQNVIARRSALSRRAAADAIRSGRVSVDGAAVHEPGYRIRPLEQRVAVDGCPLPDAETAPRTVILNKPRGYVSSRSDRDGPSVYRLLGDGSAMLRPAGRLDKQSEGLLVLSTDGDLIQRLTHPRFEHEKVYHVTVAGPVGRPVLQRLEEPFDMDGYRTRPAKARAIGDGPRGACIEITLKEGRNRQVRRMCEQAGLRVLRLVRVRIGSLRLGALRAGQWREVKGSSADVARSHQGARQPQASGGRRVGSPGRFALPS